MVGILSISGCKKEDPEKPETTHEVVVTISGEVSGAFTKAVSFTTQWKDFSGKTESFEVNGKFDGKNTTFEKTFKTTATGSTEICFSGLCNSDTSYRTEKSPWKGEWRITVTADGQEVDNFGNREVEDNDGIGVFEFFDFAKSFVDQMNLSFHDGKKYVISVSSEGVDCEIK